MPDHVIQNKETLRIKKAAAFFKGAAFAICI
jgi:hypothetical protein